MTSDEANALLKQVVLELEDDERLSFATALRCVNGVLERAWNTATDDWQLWRLGKWLDRWPARCETRCKRVGGHTFVHQMDGCAGCCVLLRGHIPPVTLADITAAVEGARRSA